MQQQQVGWDPISIRMVLPWQFKLLGLYFAVVSVLWLVRCVSLGRKLWFSRGNAELPEWNILSQRVASLKRLAALSLLLTALQGAWRLADFFKEVSIYKQIGIGTLSGEFAELLASVTLGLLVSTVLYGSYMLYQHALTRRGVGLLGGKAATLR